MFEPSTGHSQKTFPAAHISRMETLITSHPTMQALRETAGEDKTRDIVRAIGVAILQAAPAGLPTSLETLVSQTLGRLTQQDFAAIARGDMGVINRVQAMAEEQVKQAQGQNAGLGKNSVGQSSDGKGGPAPFDRFASNRAASRDTSSPSSFSRQTDGGGTEAGGYGNPQFLKSIGLSGATASTLAGMGFTTQAQIKALANDAEMLGVDKNKGSVSLGMMKSDDPANYKGHVQFFNGEYREGLEAIETMNDEIARESDPAKKAALTKRRDEAKEALETKRQARRHKSDGHSRAQQGFDDFSAEMQSSARHRHELGVQAAPKKSRTEMRSTLSRPEQGAIDKKVKQSRVEVERVSTEAVFAAFEGVTDSIQTEDGPKGEAKRPTEAKTEIDGKNAKRVAIATDDAEKDQKATQSGKSEGQPNRPGDKPKRQTKAPMPT